MPTIWIHAIRKKEKVYDNSWASGFRNKWITLDKNEMVRIRLNLGKRGIFIQPFNKLSFYYVMIQQNTKLIKACPHRTYIIGVDDSYIY